MIKFARKNPYAAWMYFDNFEEVAINTKQRLENFLQLYPKFQAARQAGQGNLSSELWYQIEDLLLITEVLESKKFNLQIDVVFNSRFNSYASFLADEHTIYLNPWVFLQQEYVDVIGALAHELQHAVDTLFYNKKHWTHFVYDPERNAEPKGKEGRRHKELWRQLNRDNSSPAFDFNSARYTHYLNSPTEVRAFVAQTIRDLQPVRDQLKANLEQSRQDKGRVLISSLRDAMPLLLVDRFGRLTPKNRVYFLKEIYKDLMRGGNSD